MNNEKKITQIYKILLAVLVLFGPQFYLLHLNATWQTEAVFLVCSIVACLLFFQDKIQSFTISKNSLKINWLVKSVTATLDDLKNIIQPLLIFHLQTLATSTTGFNVPNYKGNMNFFKSAITLKNTLNLDSKELTEAIYRAKKAVCTSTLYSIRNVLKDNEMCIIETEKIIKCGLLEQDIYNFGSFIHSIHDKNQEQAIAIYNDLIFFLKETNDI